MRLTMNNDCLECSEWWAYCAEEVENGRPARKDWHPNQGGPCPYFHPITKEQEKSKMGFYGPNDDYH